MSITRSQFHRTLQDGLSFVAPSVVSGETIDEDLAWEAYMADPERFERPDPNIEDPVDLPAYNLIMEDGPWWVRSLCATMEVGGKP